MIVPPLTEMFVRGSFSRSIAERGHKVKLLAQHDHRRFPIGKATSLVEQDDGLYGAFAIPATREGDDVLTLIHDGVFDSFSVGFRSIRDRVRDGVTVRLEAALVEVSLVACPAYEGAAIKGIRAAQPFNRISRSVAERRLRLSEISSERPQLWTRSLYSKPKPTNSAPRPEPILDAADGDLIGDDARRFDELTEQIETRNSEITEMRDRRDRCDALVGNVQSGRVRTEVGSPGRDEGATTYVGDQDRPPRTRDLDGQRLSFDNNMAAALTRSIAGERNGPPHSTSPPTAQPSSTKDSTLTRSRSAGPRTHCYQCCP